MENIVGCGIGELLAAIGGWPASCKNSWKEKKCHTAARTNAASAPWAIAAARRWLGSPTPHSTTFFSGSARGRQPMGSQAGRYQLWRATLFQKRGSTRASQDVRLDPWLPAFFLLAGWYVLPQSKQIKALKCPPKLGVSPVSPICHSPLRALAPCYIGGSIRVGKGGTDLGFADWLSNSRLCVD